MARVVEMRCFGDTKDAEIGHALGHRAHGEARLGKAGLLLAAELRG